MTILYNRAVSAITIVIATVQLRTKIFEDLQVCFSLNKNFHDLIFEVVHLDFSIIANIHYNIASHIIGNVAQPAS